MQQPRAQRLQIPPRLTHRLAELQYLRAFAAFAVVLFHASYYLAVVRGDPVMHRLFDSSFGRFGVTLFFAISGFLMAQLMPGARAAMFLVHRVVRIYPTYWLVAAVVFAWQAVRALSPQFDPNALLLIPGGPHRYLIGVEWTLPFELAFYLVSFALVALSAQRYLVPVALAWLATLVVVQLAWPQWMDYSPAHQFPSLSFVLLSEKCYGFVLGLLIPALVRRVAIDRWAIGVGLVFFAAGVALPASSNLLFGVGSACLVAAAACARPWFAKPAGTLIKWGDWSFALYLVHVPVVVWTMTQLPRAVPGPLCWLLAVGGSLAVGAAVGRFDVGIYKVLKRRFDAAPPWVAPALSGLFLATFIGAGIAVDWRAREVRRETAAAEVIAHQLAATPQASWESRWQRLGFSRADDLVGAVDLAEMQDFPDGSTGLHVTGWVVDRRAPGERAAVLIFESNQLVGIVIPELERADVAAQFNFRASLPVAFVKRMQLPRCVRALEIVAVTHRRYARLPDATLTGACGDR